MGLTPELLRSLDLPQFEDAITARRYLESQAWPEGPVCAHCGEPERVSLASPLPAKSDHRFIDALVTEFYREQLA